MTTRVLGRIVLAFVPVLMAGVSGAGEGVPSKAEVPFAFVVKGAVLPAGTYEVSSRRDMLILRGPEDTTCVLGSGLASLDDRRPKLVFHRSGGTYVLREVWTGGGHGHEIRPSRAERERLDRARSRQGPIAFEEVVVLARS